MEGREQVDDALEAGRASADLRLRMPPLVARQIGELIDLLDAADDETPEEAAERERRHASRPRADHEEEDELLDAAGR